MVNIQMNTQKFGVAATAATGAFILLFGLYLFNKRKNRVPSKWRLVGYIKKLYIYPLKSGRRVELQKAFCTEYGLKECDENLDKMQLQDRTFAVYHENSKEYRTIRTYPNLVLVEISSSTNGYVTFKAPDMRPLFVKVPEETNNNRVTVKHFGQEEIDAIDCGDEAAKWFSNYCLNRDEGLRLGYNAVVPKRRNIQRAYAKEIAYYKNLSNESTGIYSDLAGAHLLSQPSITDLKKRLDKDIPVDENNFRPTIFVDGDNIEPYDEEKWDFIKLGEDVVIRNVMECTRCMIPTINPETGVRRTDREPSKTLETYKRSVGPSNNPVMGILCGIYRTGYLKVGDPVYVECQ